jgi:hypothetical protein
MNSERIKAIQSKTAYPDSLSVYQALMQVWNECQQESEIDNGIIELGAANKILNDIRVKMGWRIELNLDNGIWQILVYEAESNNLLYSTGSTGLYGAVISLKNLADTGNTEIWEVHK